MLQYLSRFSLATRIYAGFLVLGIYVVSACFLSVLAVGYVHREYKKANNVIENTRQLSALENSSFDFNRSLYFYALNGTDEERKRVEDAFRAFEDKYKETEAYLENPETREKYKQVLSVLAEKYQTEMTETFSLQEKSVEATEKVNSLAEKASKRLNALIEETTLPSAAFALNGLREELDAVLRSIEAASSENADSQRQLNTDFSALKKAQNVARQAEMINTKQLKALFTMFGGLEEEINRKLKIDKALHEKRKALFSAGDQNVGDLKELVAATALSCAQFLSEAEAGKISLQKAFVFAAAFGGVLAVLLSFLSLFGIRYPLVRLIENAQEMARGERSVQIRFSERDDEVGSLAKALTALAAKLKERPFLPNDLLNRQTYGSGMAYIAAGTEAEKSGNDELYFGQEAGLDPESQLCQILFLVQHINAAADRMTEDVKRSFSELRDHLNEVRALKDEINAKLADVGEKLKDGGFSALSEEMNKFIDSFSESFASFDETRVLLEKQDGSLNALVSHLEQMQIFVSRLMEWGRVAGEMTSLIHSLSVETKILSLNASIEAAKSGENAKSFSSICLDMRGKTNETAEIAERLTTHLTSVREDVVRFSEIMNAVGFQIDELRHCADLIQPVREGQIVRIQASIAQAEVIKNVVSDSVENNDEIRTRLNSLPQDVEKISQACAVLEEQLTKADLSVDEFTSSLPTYEEEKESTAKEEEKGEETEKEEPADQ